MVFSLLNHGSDGLESKAQFFCLPVLAALFLSFCSDDKMCAFLMMTSLRSAHVLQTQSSAAKKQPNPRCLKITEKVSHKIASEGSYVYILSLQK